MICGAGKFHHYLKFKKAFTLLNAFFFTLNFDL